MKKDNDRGEAKPLTAVEMQRGVMADDYDTLERYMIKIGLIITDEKLVDSDKILEVKDLQLKTLDTLITRKKKRP